MCGLPELLRLQAVEQHHPDMVLMDIRIQGEMDGIETRGGS